MNKLKNWQLFLISIFPVFVSRLFDDEFTKDLIEAGFFLVVITYFLLIGDFLNNINSRKNHWFFLFNCSFIIILYFLSSFNFNIEKEALITGLGIYFLFAYVFVTDELAVKLRKAEGKDVSNYKQASDFLLFFIWPVGIWILQPRINKLEE